MQAIQVHAALPNFDQAFSQRRPCPPDMQLNIFLRETLAHKQRLYHLPQQTGEHSTQFSGFDERHMSNLVIVTKLPMANLPGQHTDRQHAVPSPANRACGKHDLTCGVITSGMFPFDRVTFAGLLSSWKR